jgi:phospho-N-acetylmuramoyl-pentapeptide-transferase
MLYFFAKYLQNVFDFGPFRMLQSHMVLMGLGAFLSAFLVWFFLPRLMHKLPVDRGKTIKTAEGKVEAVTGNQASAGKPTGAGVLMALLILPILLLFFPITNLSSLWDLGVIACIYLCMLSGWLDDKAINPWSGFKKGCLDVITAMGAAYCLSHGQGITVWWPFTTAQTFIPLYIYLPLAGLLLFGAINTTNCSDGIDSLAGLLTLLTLISLTGLLYMVIGHVKIANYLLIPHNIEAAKWAVLTMIFIGTLGAYLWYNCYPSILLMGDAGSRMFGIVIGIASLATGNLCIILVVAPMILINGGLGIVKLILLKAFKAAGHPVYRPKEGETPTCLQRIFFRYTFPLHDHCRKTLKWSGQQVVMRFFLLQAALLPILLLLFIKVR